MIKICKNCKKEFVRPKRQGFTTWEKRKFCSLNCYYNFNQKENHSNWKGGFRRRKYHLRKIYHIGLEVFDNLYKSQNCLCAICVKGEATCIDHNHKTRQIRNLLCRKCNLAIGFFDDNIELLRKAIIYLEKFT